MIQTICSDTLLYSLSSCKYSAGYFFVNKHYSMVNQLANLLCPELTLPNNDFDIGFLKWNSMSDSLSIVLQKLSTNNTIPFIKNLLSEIDILYIDEDCRKYSYFYLGKNNDYEVIFVE